LAAADVNSFLMDQSVMSFAGTAARGSAIPSPVEGMTTYLEDSDRYESYNSSAWTPVVSTGEWVSYTPVLTNMTLGNGTISAAYSQIGKTINVRFRFLLGSTSSINASTPKTVSLPLDIRSGIFSTQDIVGIGSANFPGPGILVPFFNNVSSVRIGVIDTATAFSGVSNITNTVPFTWGNGNTITFTMTYEAA